MSISWQVEQGEPGRELVIAEVDGRRALGHVQDVAVEVRSLGALRERLAEGRGPEMLVDVEARHRQAQILPDRISWTSGSRSGSEAPSSRNGTKRRTLSRSRAVPAPSRGAAEVAGLGGEHQLDRGDARSEADHLLEPSRRQRRHRHPVLDPLGLGRRDEVERDGLREQPRLDRDRLDRDAVLAERALRQRRPGAEALREARQVSLQELHRPLRRRRDHRGEREPGDVERGRERLHLEVADRDHPVLGDDDERVRLRRVELDRELGADERERVARCAVLLGDRPERERVLQVARHHLAALEQRAEAGQRRLQARIRSRLADRRMDGVPVRAERLEVERARVVEDVEQHERIGERKRGVAGRERALVEERDRLAAGELEVAEEAVGEVGHLGEIALADRAERADLRQPVGVQRRDEMRRELGTGHGRRAREGVREPERGRPHDLVGDGSALRDAVLADEEPVVPVGVDVEYLAAADPGRDPVGRRAARRSSGRRRHAPWPSRRAPPASISTCAPPRATASTSSSVSVGAGQDDACHATDHPMISEPRRVARTALPAAQSANAPAATRTIVPPGGVSA